MKKLTALCLVALLLVGVFALSGCSSKSNTDDENTFVVGFDAEFPPYGYADENGEYTGFDLELAQKVCDSLGWELVKKPIDWNSKDLELNSGSIDCIWNGFTIDGRENDYTWSKPYVDNSQVVVVMADSGITALSELAGKNVAVQADSSALAALTGEDATAENIALRESFTQLLEVPDYNTAFLNLESGAVDAIAVDIGVAQYQVAQRGEGYLILDEILSSEQYGIGFKLGNTELCDLVEAELDKLVSDGTFMELAEKYGLADDVCLGK